LPHSCPEKPPASAGGVITIPWINPRHSVEPDRARREDQILMFLDLVVYPADAHAPPDDPGIAVDFAPSLQQPGAVHIRVLVGVFVREPSPAEASCAFERGLTTDVEILERHFGARYRTAILGTASRRRRSP
jgi:hypothetical protein